MNLWAGFVLTSEVGVGLSFLCVSVARLDEKNVHTEAIKRKHREFLESWNPLVFLKNPSRVAEVSGPHVTADWELSRKTPTQTEGIPGYFVSLKWLCQGSRWFGCFVFRILVHMNQINHV